MSTTTTIATTAAHLRDLLAPVIPFTGKGAHLPVLDTIRLRGHGSQMTATATDRYRLGMVRAKIAAPEGFEALLPWISAKAILATFKASRDHNPDLTLTFDPADRVVHVETAGLSDDIAGARIGYRLLDAQYPPVDSVLARAFAGGHSEPVALSGKLLADFAHVVRDGLPLVIVHGPPNSAAGISCGDHFIGALMAVRMSDDGDVGLSRDAWAGIVDLAVPAPAAEAVPA